MSQENSFRHFYPVDAPKAIDPKYRPFVDIDNNGVIILTLFDVVGHETDQIVFINVSRQFNGLGLREAHPDLNIVIDFQNKLDKDLHPDSLNKVLGYIEKLYTNEIDSLALRNLPAMDYDTLADCSTKEHVAIQWDRKDLDKLAAHIRMLYDSRRC